jgi:hypothetical protein
MRVDLPQVSSVTSLLAVIRTLGSPLGPRLKRELATDLYSVSTSIARYDESDHWANIEFHQTTPRPRSQR